nr:hypothetical protein [Tanacetum cinerariifolium]
MQADELYKFSKRTVETVHYKLHHQLLDFRLEYNDDMPRKKWKDVDRKRSGLMVELIDKQMRERRIIRNLERLVGALELEMEYRPMTQHQSDTKVFTMTMEILSEPTSNKLYDRSALTTPKVDLTKHDRMTKPYSSTIFIANGLFVDQYYGGEASLRMS